MAHPCERVLIVDDDADNRDSIAMILEEEGVDVRAANAHDALDALRAGYRPDVIVLDLVMPGISGRVFREHLERDARLGAIPIVLCTASPQLAQGAGFVDAVIAKPFDADAFFRALAELCLEAKRTVL
jgi:CheY-like chemotaxis protein